MIDRVVLESIAKEISGKISEKKGVFTLEATIAERKAFLSTKKLTYIANIKLDENSKEVHFSETIKESGAGISSGLDMDSGSGFGFKKEVYKSGSKGREGSIEEISKMFGKDYNYKFDYSAIRERIKTLSETSEYKFVYHIIPDF